MWEGFLPHPVQLENGKIIFTILIVSFSVLWLSLNLKDISFNISGVIIISPSTVFYRWGDMSGEEKDQFFLIILSVGFQIACRRPSPLQVLDQQPKTTEYGVGLPRSLISRVYFVNSEVSFDIWQLSSNLSEVLFQVLGV